MPRFALRLFAMCVVIAVGLGATGCSQPYYSGPVSDHFDGERFRNLTPPRETSRWAALQWQFNRNMGPWPEWVENEVMDKPPARIEGPELRVSFVNHNTVLLQTQGLNILTDPIWAERASPISFLGPKRVRAPGIRFDDLPKIDVVLVSHNHYDHLDTEVLSRLWQRDRPRIIAPLGNDAIITNHDKTVRVDVLDWGQGFEIAPDVKVVLEPMQHWSARGLRDTDQALWGSFVILAPGGNIYFVGDTGYAGGRFYKEAAAKYGPFRFTLMPIGAYEPRWFMEYAHQNPEEAVLGHFDAQSCFTLATQHSTFPMADDSYEAPVRDLAAARAKHNLAEDKFRALMNGAHWLIPQMTTGADGKTNCAA